MPQVPSYQPNVTERPALQRNVAVQARPDDFGASIGQGLQGAARGLGEASQNFAEIQRLDDIAAAKDREVQFANWEREASKGEQGFLNLTGAAAVQGREAFERSLVEKRREFADGLSNGARRAYALATEGRVEQSRDVAAAHVAQERKAWTINASNSRILMFADDAATSWGSPDKVEENLQHGLDELRRQGSLLGWDADTLRQKSEVYVSAVLSNVLMAQAQHDPLAAAERFLERCDRFSAEDGLALWNNLLPQIKDAAAREATLGEDGIQFSPRLNALIEAMPADGAAEVREGVTQELLRQRSAAAAQAKVAYDEHKGNVELGILTGAVSSEESILADPMLEPSDKATLIRSLRTEQNANGAARDFLGRLGIGVAPTLNPYSPDDQTTADKSFAMLMEALQPEQQAAAASEFISTTGMIPKTVLADVRMGLNSADEAELGAALEQSAMLFDAAPRALDALENGKEIREAAATYAELVGNRGLSVGEAARHVLEMRDPANIAKAEVLQAGWDQALKDKQFKINDVLAAYGDNMLPGGPVGGVTPAQEAALMSDYLRAAERAFNGPANGDVGLARQMALQEMKRTFGITRVSGGEVIVKYPPEAHYPAIEGSQDYIRQLALRDARTLAPDALNVMLVTTPETSKDVRAGTPPRYDLFYQRPDGVWDVAPGMFMVSGEEINALSDLASQERAILFEAERARDRQTEAKGDAMGPSIFGDVAAQIIDLMDMEPVEGDAERKARLSEIEAKRRALYGIPEPETDAPASSHLLPAGFR